MSEINDSPSFELRDQIKDDIDKVVGQELPEIQEEEQEKNILRKSLDQIRSSVERTSEFIKQEVSNIKEIYHKFKKRDSNDSFMGAVFNCNFSH